MFRVYLCVYINSSSYVDFAFDWNSKLKPVLHIQLNKQFHSYHRAATKAFLLPKKKKKEDA